ncbi:hypothetical protein X975_06777, partial [Stegodyphus mimosarum]
MKPKYEDNATLLFTDTESLCYLAETKDIYAHTKDDCYLFDSSDYLEDHALFSSTNKKVLWEIKDELSGEVAQEFVKLKAKMYSLQISSQ